MAARRSTTAAPRNDRGIGGEHVYLPRFNHREGHRRDYLRGFGMQFWNTGNSPNGPAPGAYGLPGFGASLKREIKRRHPAWVELHPFGEVLPYAHNRITVDAAQTDRYGVPLARIDYRIGENEAEDGRAHGRHGGGHRARPRAASS